MEHAVILSSFEGYDASSVNIFGKIDESARQ